MQVIKNTILAGAIEYQYLSINGNAFPPNIGANTASIAISLGSAANCRTIIRGNVTCPPSNSFYNSTAVTSLIDIYGNITNNGTWNTIAAPAFRVTASSLLTVATTSSAGLTSSIYQSGSSFTYPSTNDVRVGTIYGNTNQYSGLMNIPPVNDVRLGTSVNTGSATGSVILPSANDIRLGIPFDTGSTGLVYIPLRSVVSQSANVDNTTGTYTGLEDFWSFGTSSFTAGGTGKLIQTNLDVNVGSVSASFLTALNDPLTTNPTVKRLQNLARVQDMGDQIASSSYV